MASLRFFEHDGLVQVYGYGNIQSLGCGVNYA